MPNQTLPRRDQPLAREGLVDLLAICRRAVDAAPGEDFIDREVQRAALDLSQAIVHRLVQAVGQ